MEILKKHIKLIGACIGIAAIAAGAAEHYLAENPGGTLAGLVMAVAGAALAGWMKQTPGTLSMEQAERLADDRVRALTHPRTYGELSGYAPERTLGDALESDLAGLVSDDDDDTGPVGGGSR